MAIAASAVLVTLTPQKVSYLLMQRRGGDRRWQTVAQQVYQLINADGAHGAPVTITRTDGFLLRSTDQHS